MLTGLLITAGVGIALFGLLFMIGAGKMNKREDELDERQ